MIDEYVNNWILKANNDFKSIEHELTFPESEIITDVVCFHCQQAVEKYLKAYLVYHAIEIERTHNIKYILHQCSKIDNDFFNIEIGELSTFGVDIRYPDEIYFPSIEEVRYYYDVTKKIRELVLTKLGLKFDKSHKK